MGVIKMKESNTQLSEIEIKELAEKEFALYWEELWDQGLSQRSFLKMMEKSYRILYIQAYIDGYNKAIGGG